MKRLDLVKRLSPRSRLLVVGTLLLLAWGCGSYDPLRPSALTPELLPPPPSPALVSSPGLKNGTAAFPEGPVLWIDGTVVPTSEQTLRGGRYELVFPAGAVMQSTNVKLTEPDRNQILFELEPHGAQFNRPVVLTISYAGTNADPDSKLYDGSRPVLLWFDDAKRGWVEVRGVSDVTEKIHIVQLSHFSTYSLAGEIGEIGGKGGW